MKFQNTVFRFKEINITDEEEDFAERFVVRGENGKAVRKCFTSDFMDQCLATEGVSLEVREGDLILVKNKGLKSPEEMVELGVGFAQVLSS